MKKTHCGYVLSLMSSCRNELKLEKANYTADGVEAVIYDPYDKQRYRVTVTPIAEASGK